MPVFDADPLFVGRPRGQYSLDPVAWCGLLLRLFDEPRMGALSAEARIREVLPVVEGSLSGAKEMKKVPIQSPPPILAIFDIDGTLCDTQESDGLCFGRAVESVTGRPFAAQDWTTFEEPTGGAILRDLLADDPNADGNENAIKTEFLRLLQEQRQLCPSEFMPVPGANAFIDRLRRGKICDVAIATGCFDVSAKFKLRCCGLDLGGFPHATSSDTPRRQDIIRLAASRAGYALSSVVHFGDGAWDVKATRALGIPMIGIGRGYTKLRSLGVEHAFRDFSNADAIISVLDGIRARFMVAES